MGRNIDSSIHSYEAAHAAMQARETKRGRTDSIKLAGNTYLIRGPSQADLDSVLPPGTTDAPPLYYAVRLHNTNIVTFHANGDVTLDTGGWKTKTTLHRMRGFFPGSEWPKLDETKRRAFLRWSLACRKGEWSVECERVENVPSTEPGGFSTYNRTPVKSFPFSRTLTLQRAPRTAGGFKLKRSEAYA